MKITSGARTVFMINIAFCALIYAASFFEFEEPEQVAVITGNTLKRNKTKYLGSD